MLARNPHIYCMALEMNDPMKPKPRQKRALRILSWRKKSVHADGKPAMPRPISFSTYFFFISPIQTLIAFELSCAARNTIFPTVNQPNPPPFLPSSPFPRKGKLNQGPGQLHETRTLPLHLIESPEKLGALSQPAAWAVCMIRDLGRSLLESLRFPPMPIYGPIG